MRLRTVDAELIRAADGIGQLSKVAPSVVVDKPQLGASFMGVASLPVQVTDELVPPFVDGTVEGGTDPIVTISTEEDKAATDDDDGPLDSLRPQDDVRGASVALQSTEPDLRAKDLFDRSRLAPADANSETDENDA